MLCTRLTNARFLIMDPDNPAAHDLGIWRGRIVRLDEAVTSLPAREVIDLQGATVLPGFIDAHVHLAWTGFKANTLGIAGRTRIDDVLAFVAEAAGRAGPPGGWLSIAGYEQRASESGQSWNRGGKALITATPRPAPEPHTLHVQRPSVRTARQEDAAALAELSRPFVCSGALRERPASLYATNTADFLVTEVPGGPLDGCVGLRVHPGTSGNGRGPVGVLYNFCVAGHQQGRGVGAGLLRAALAVAQVQSLGALFTATTGDGGLFLRYGFVPTTARSVPPSWAASLDPRRGARILSRLL